MTRNELERLKQNIAGSAKLVHSSESVTIKRELLERLIQGVESSLQQQAELTRALYNFIVGAHGSRSQLSPPSTPKEMIEEALGEHGIGVDAVRSGRTAHIRLYAKSAAKIISGGDLALPDVVVSGDKERPWAKVYVTSERRRGQAQFSANGYQRDTSPAVYLFVLASERRVWVATRAALAAFEDEARKGGSRSGIGVLPNQPGTLRLWLRREESAQFELHNRIKPALESA